MYINKVAVKNYRNFTEFSVDLGPLTVIVGENESGKSNFFAALSLVLGGNDIVFSQRRLSVSDINTNAILSFYQAILSHKPDEDCLKLVPKVSVEVEFTDPKDEYEEALLRRWLKPSEDGRTYGLRYDFRPRNDNELLEATKSLLLGKRAIEEVRWFTLPMEFYDFQIVSTNNEKQIPFSDLRKVVLNIINAERDDFSEASSMKSNSLLTRMLVTSLEDAEKASINSAYVDFFRTIEDTDTFKKIIKLDPGLANFSKLIDDIDCIPNLPNLKNILSNITLKTGDEFLFQRGLGRRNLVYIILLFEFFRSDKKYFNLCCIEEPEAHLGVNNLRIATDFVYKSTKIGGSLLQALITSHNPAVINKLELSNVVVFSGEKAISLRNTSKELVDYLRKRPNFDILKLLFAERVMLVEGPTEEMFVNSLFAKSSEELSRVEVLAIGQKGFRTFLDIWLHVNKGNPNKKIGVVRDHDNSENAKSEHQKYETENSNVCVRTTVGYTLENDLVGAGVNREKLAKLYRLNEKLGEKEVAEHMINSKAASMLKLCDALLHDSEPIDITPPNHIKEIIEFLK